MNEKRFYWHVVANGRKEERQGYLHRKTYRSERAALQYAERMGLPVWIVKSAFKYLSLTGGPDYRLLTLGDFEALRWNSGSGLVKDTMPRLPFLG